MPTTTWSSAGDLLRCSAPLRRRAVRCVISTSRGGEGCAISSSRRLGRTSVPPALGVPPATGAASGFGGLLGWPSSQFGSTDDTSSAFLQPVVPTALGPAVNRGCYFQSLLHGLSGDRAAHIAPLSVEEVEPQAPASSSVLVSEIPAATNGSTPCPESDSQLGSDDNELLSTDDEADDEGVDGDSEHQVESAFVVDSEDGFDYTVEIPSSQDIPGLGVVCKPSTRVLSDEELQFKIIPTSLGDCGCVSTNAGFKKRVMTLAARTAQRETVVKLSCDCTEAKTMAGM
ncbi:hypothetical protein C2845_PM01G05790 [Panicum miliaceum]|uniref:Uncharacterized protein n=1 Tax=Panicum miliaceum TaxID=4540 RepID=A0A3L6TG75_PANMI|nr:hypothetical protein C2845_PM01G05790 [Panicum miliaceum]